MRKGKILLVFLGLGLLLGLIVLPVGITQAKNSGQPAFQVNLSVFLPVIMNQKVAVGPTSPAPKPTGTTVPQSAPTTTPRAGRTPTRAVPTLTKAAPTATRANPTATKAAPTVTQAVPTATKAAPTATRAVPTATKAAPTATAAVPPSGSFTFLSWADTKTGTSKLAALSIQAKKLNPAFTFYEGDLQDAGFNASTISTWANALNGNASNGMSNITFSLRGNHDTSNTGSWQSYFNTSATAARIGATQFTSLTNNLTYAFDYGNSYFIGIDVPGNAELITSAQIAFLDSGLAGAEARGLTHAFVFFHGPIYPVSSHTSCTTRVCATPSQVVNLVKVLNKHSIVSAVFNGHEHVQAYVHLDSSRVPEITHPFEEFITGTAGAGSYPCDKTYRFEACGTYSGFATIMVSGRSFTVNVYQQDSAAPVKTYTFTKP